MSSRNNGFKKSDKKKRKYSKHVMPLVPQIFPNFYEYPMMYGPGQWAPPYLQPNFPYFSHDQAKFLQSDSNLVPNQTFIPAFKDEPSDSNEYTMKALRSIYNNDDGSIEIERVKVHRRSLLYDNKSCSQESPQVFIENVESPLPQSFDKPVPEKIPPPRKKKKNLLNWQNSQSTSNDTNQNWYPFMPYIPQPYPVPYPYMWPLQFQEPIICYSSSEESDSSNLQKDSLPSSPASSSTKDGNSCPDKSTETSHDVDCINHLKNNQDLSDILLSDYVSLKETTPKTYTPSNTSTSTILNHKPYNLNSSDQIKEWMDDMQKILALENPNDLAGDRSSFVTAYSEIPTPPRNTSKSGSKFFHKKSHSESNISLQDEFKSNISPPLLSNTRVSDTDLTYAFKKLEKTADTFKSHAVECQGSEITLQNLILPQNSEILEGHQSSTSTTSFHSTKQSADENEPADTDSTDIAFPEDTSTANESTENVDSDISMAAEEEINYKWILKDTKIDKEFTLQADKKDTNRERINCWKREVSLWRARLVVSLCKGQGLDEDDWEIFQFLVQHPLPVDLKLSLIDAYRICSLNCDLGVVFLRNSLLQLTSYGETILKPEETRPIGWKIIKLDCSQSWTLVKGSIEILCMFGYRLQKQEYLKFKKTYSLDKSVIARVTLDILVLAEEFRLYLSGTHQSTKNIKKLFAPLYQSPFVIKKQTTNLSVNKEVNNFGNESPAEATLSYRNKEDKDKIDSDINFKSNRPCSEILSQNNFEKIDSMKTDLQKNELSIKDRKLDNPENHIYEEITELRGKVQKLKSNSKNKDYKPPLLPPKAKVNTNCNELTIINKTISEKDKLDSFEKIPPVPESRKKKRRAPMPPSFIHDLSNDNKFQENVELTSTEKFNPFHEKSNELQDEPREYNPFNESHNPSGYVGKNPFYEDVDKLVKIENKKDQNTSANGIIPGKEEVVKVKTNLDFVNTKMTNLEREDSMDQNKIIVRPERRKYKINKPNDKNKDKKCTNISNLVKLIDANKTECLETLQPENKNYIQDSCNGMAKEKKDNIAQSKNEKWGHQSNSLVAVPNKTSEKEREKINTKKETNKSDVIIKEIVISYEIDFDKIFKNSLKSHKKANTHLNSQNVEPLLKDHSDNTDSKLKKSTDISSRLSPNSSIKSFDDIPFIETQVSNDLDQSSNTDSKLTNEKFTDISHLSPNSSAKYLNKFPFIETQISELEINNANLETNNNNSDIPPDYTPPPPPNYSKHCSDNEITNSKEDITAASLNKLTKENQSSEIILNLCDNKKYEINTPIYCDEKAIALNNNKESESELNSFPDFHSSLLFDTSSSNVSLHLDDASSYSQVKTSLKELNKISLASESETLLKSEKHTPPLPDLLLHTEGDVITQQHKESLIENDFSKSIPLQSESETISLTHIESNITSSKLNLNNEINENSVLHLKECEENDSVVKVSSTTGSNSDLTKTISGNATLSFCEENINCLSNTINDDEVNISKENVSDCNNFVTNSDDNVDSCFRSLVEPSETPHVYTPDSPVKLLHSKNELSNQGENNDSNNISSKNIKYSESFNNCLSDSITQSTTLCENNKDEIVFCKNLKEKGFVEESSLLCKNNNNHDHIYKENIMFENKEQDKSFDAHLKTLEKTCTSKCDFEERYEIPDALLAEEYLKKMKNLTADTNLKERKIPAKPPRHVILKAPPLPPKTKDLKPPVLPPKTKTVSCFQLSSFRSSSLIFPLKSKSVEIIPNRQSYKKHKFQHSTTSISSHSKTASPLTIPNKQTTRITYIYNKPKGHEPTQINVCEQKTTKTIYTTTEIKYKSTSTPTSPDLRRMNLDSQRATWPFQICNCIYSNESCDHDKYVMNEK